MQIEEYRELLRKQSLQSLVGIRESIDLERQPERAKAAIEEISRRQLNQNSPEHVESVDRKAEQASDFIFRWVSFHFAFYLYLIFGVLIGFENLWFKVPFAIGAIGLAIGYFFYLACPFCKRYPKSIITFMPSIPFIPPRKCKHCQSEFWWKQKR